jgi:hypothetical protein
MRAKAKAALEAATRDIADRLRRYAAKDMGCDPRVFKDGMIRLTGY